MILKSTLNIILDALFPVHCFFCQKIGAWLCANCRNTVLLLEHQVCPYCEKNISPQGKICSACRLRLINKNDLYFLDSLIAGTKYSDVSSLVHFYKYSFIADLHIPLGEILLESFLKNNSDLPDMIIPVPLHRRRLRWRGFNQAELLGNYLAGNIAPGLDIAVENNILARKKFTDPQMKVKDYQKRKENIASAFSLDKKYSDRIKDKKILLVDDIATTGATLFECAKILKSGGAQKVSAMVVARQEMK